MTPATKFAVQEKYDYLEGFGSYHSSEALPGATPHVNNTPRKPPLGLVTERISGSSFTAPRAQNLQTWMYRSASSLQHGEFELIEGSAPPRPNNLTPNSHMWTNFPSSPGSDWITSQRLLASNGEPNAKDGLSIWVFSIDTNMNEHAAFSSLDGDSLIILQAGALDIQTELGKLLVRQNEIAVIPRGIRYRVDVVGTCARGYICELYQGHFQIPELGPIGSTGLANVRDFQIPKAFFNGRMEKSVAMANNAEWQIVSRMSRGLWKCEQDHTPFDVAAWHGTFYPYKFDLARFVVLGNVLFDEHDPSLYVVLTAPSYGEPGAAVVDFAIIPPRWQVAEDTFMLPYYHRNTMNEFYGPIVNHQDPKLPLNSGLDFQPFGAGLNGLMTTHGASDEDYAKAQNADNQPKKIMTDGITVFLLETEKQLQLSEWAAKASQKNFKAASRERKAKM